MMPVVYSRVNYDPLSHGKILDVLSDFRNNSTKLMAKDLGQSGTGEAIYLRAGVRGNLAGHEVVENDAAAENWADLVSRREPLTAERLDGSFTWTS